jgi:hypothetical protein
MSIILSKLLLAANAVAFSFCVAEMANDLNRPLRRRLQIQNKDGVTASIEWVKPVMGEAVPYGETIASGDKFFIDSYVNHTFPFRASPDNETVSYVTILPKEDEQVILVKKYLIMKRIDQMVPPKFQELSTIVQSCRSEANAELASGLSLEAAIQQLLKCAERGTATMIAVKNEELAFQQNLRRSIANFGENYTCADPQLETTVPKLVTTWTHEGEERTVGILHQHKASQIHILQDFISPEECAAIQEAAAPLLHRGTVADGKGGSILSENRKAWQAGVQVHEWTSKEDPIAAVKRRLFAYANHATGYNMTLDGQEELMSIQYFGNGKNDAAPDRYMPHCDGDCNDLPHKTGGRVATMVMYCDVPDLGGATNFQQANVFVKPAQGAAAFFSYMDPVTKIHDQGFTTHSGCPVLEGTKRIAVQWMRIGVDSENPWDSFDTNTLKIGA